MIVTYTIEKSLLFDGFEEQALTAYFELDTDTGYSVQVMDFVNNSFEGLKTVIDRPDYERIIETGNFTMDNGFLHLPKGSDGLSLFFCKRNNTIFVFAFGETQPMRYKLYLEGIWVTE